MVSSTSSPVGLMLLGRDYRLSAKFAGISGLVFGIWFTTYSLMLGGVFGLPNYQGWNTIIELFIAVGLVIALGVAAYHSARNRGVLVSWLLGTAFLFAFMLYTEATYHGLSVILLARTFWEATVFGVPFGTIGFCLGVTAHHIRTRTYPTRINLLYVVATVVGSVLVAGLLFSSCDLVFGGRCFGANLA